MAPKKSTENSPYHVNGWTVTKLKDELRFRNLSPVGSKKLLIERLENNDVATESPSKKEDSALCNASYLGLSNDRLMEECRALNLSDEGTRMEMIERLRSRIYQPSNSNPFLSESPTKKSTRHRSPSKGNRSRSPTKSPGNKASPRQQHSKARKNTKKTSADQIGLTVSPLLTASLFTRCCWISLKNFVSDKIKQSQFPFILMSLSTLVMLFIGLNVLDGPHQQFLSVAQKHLLLYGKWFALGVLSSVGLGTGAHTFILFLGPFIARVTTAAYVCGTLNFPLHGEHSLLCPPGSPEYARVTITIWSILNKIKWESAAWGLGTAVGELPPYLIARASAIAGRSSGQLVEMKSLQSKKNPTAFERLSLLSYWLVQKLGFFGILVCASVPNPFFDLAGITCGYFMVPFFTFLLATLIGKAFIKCSVQTVFVILLFSKDYLEQAIGFIQDISPAIGKPFHQWIINQRSNFQAKYEFMSEMQTNVYSLCWHAILISMMGYFVFSVVRSAAILQAKRERRLAA